MLKLSKNLSKNTNSVFMNIRPFKMRKIHPCCGLSSQLGAKFLAICDLIFGLIGIFWFIYILESSGLLLKEFQTTEASEGLHNRSTNQTNHVTANNNNITITPTFNDWFLSLQQSNGSGNNESVVLYHKGSLFAVTNSGIEIYQERANIIMSGLYTLINLCLSVVLLSAANEESVCLLITWFAIRLFIILFKVVIYIVYIVIGVAVFIQIPHIFFMLVHSYGLWIIWVFIKEIKERNHLISSQACVKPSKSTEVDNKEFEPEHEDSETENDPPLDRPQKRKMTITIIEPDRVTIFEPYVGDGAGVEVGTEKQHKDTECENNKHEDKVIKSILHKPSTSTLSQNSPNSNNYRNSY